MGTGLEPEHDQRRGEDEARPHLSAGLAATPSRTVGQLTSQLYLQRNNVSDLLCNGRNINRKTFKNLPENGEELKISLEKIDIRINFNPKGTNKQIIKELSDAYLFQIDENIQKDKEAILKYDFDASSKNSQQAVVRLFNFITKSPEFQLI